MKLPATLWLLVSVLCRVAAQGSLEQSNLAEAERTLPIPQGWHVVALTSPSKVLEGDAPSKSGTGLSLAEAFGHLGKDGFERSDSADTRSVAQGAGIDDALASQIPPGWRVKGYTAGAMPPPTTQSRQIIQPGISQPISAQNSATNNNEQDRNVVDSALASQIPLGWHVQDYTKGAEPQAIQASQATQANIPHEDNAATGDELASLIPSGWHVQGYAAGAALVTSPPPMAQSVGAQSSKSMVAQKFERQTGQHVIGSENDLASLSSIADAAPTQIRTAHPQKSSIARLTNTHSTSLPKPPMPAEQRKDGFLKENRMQQTAPLLSRSQQEASISNALKQQASISNALKQQAGNNASIAAAQNQTVSSMPAAVDEPDKQDGMQKPHDDADMDIAVPHEAAVDTMFSYSPSISAIKGDSESEVEEQVPVVSETVLGRITSVDCLTEAINNGGNPCTAKNEPSAKQEQRPTPLDLPVSHAFLGGTKVYIKKLTEHTKSVPVEKHNVQNIPRPTIELHTRQQERRNRDLAEPLKLETQQQKRRHRDHVEHVVKGRSHIEHVVEGRSTELASATSDHPTSQLVDKAVQASPIGWLTRFMREVRSQPMRVHNLADGMGMHGSD